MVQNNQSKKYKDTVFVDLFSEDETAKHNFISLYNALFDENLTEDDEIKNIRLDQVLYISLRNDVSFLVNNKLIVLAEHQSTINENMPLRFLEYVGRLYERTQNPKDRYLRKLVKIPKPEFFVFYNGEEDYPVEQTLKLSDAFLTEDNNKSLELRVKVFNINKNKNNQILKKCKELNDYSEFIEEVRKNRKIDPDHGFEKAIKSCIEKGILKEYLERKNMEVENMLIAEYDYEMDIAVQREEATREAEKKAEKKAKETVKELKNMGVDINKLSKATGLTIEEIKAL